MTTNPVIDGGNVNGRIRNFSTISALNLLVSNISTGTTSVDQIYTRNINIDPPSTVYISHPDLTINANLTTDEGEDPQPNNLNLLASSNVNIQCGNNPSAFSVNITGDTYVSRTFTASLGISTTNINLSTINGAAYVPGGGGVSVSSFTNLFATNASTTNLFVSSINGAAYPPGGGGGWVSTATTQLFMNDFPINLRNTSTTGLAYGSVAPYSVGIDGPYLFGNTQGALGTVSPANDISLAWDAAEVNIYKTLDMEDNFILNVSTITASGELSISANNDILTSSVSTINTVQNTYFSGGVSRRLDGQGVLQPVIQYGEFASSGGSGNTTVTLPAAYTAVNTFVAFACMEDRSPARVSVVKTDTSNIEVYWSGAGGGSHTIVWQTLGT
jgi:hypothetical protein